MPLQPFEATIKLCRASKWRISNLELQKLLFLAQKDFMKLGTGRLVIAGFEAWEYGPVIPEIYRAVRRFGARPIENIFHGFSYGANVDDVLLLGSYEKYKHKTPGELVALTHRRNGAWDVNYRPNVLGIRIPDEDIRKEARFGRAN